MNIYLLTSVYPAKDAPKGTTPVVHYFAKEWVAMGHQVHVFHLESVFPRPYYIIGKLFKNTLDSRLGHLVPNKRPIEYEETKDGVIVTHLLLKKNKPHGRFPKKQIKKTFVLISDYIQKECVPDCFVGHWDNPQLDLLHLLKEKFKRPTCLVYHSNDYGRLIRCYGDEFDILRNDIDLVGFRNQTSKNIYIKRFGVPEHSFIASSGISSAFIDAGRNSEKTIDTIRKFIFVGAIVERKYPLTNLNALAKSYKNEPFSMTYIGEGIQMKDLEPRFKELNCSGSIKVTGRIPRNEVISYLNEADVFVMISKDELFGLVYLEAMALGCITIGSRKEGIDGIIIDGENGFLCEAGNEDELSIIIDKIRSMTPEQLKQMSDKAKQTAFYYSDVNVAERYVEQLRSISSI